MIPRNSVIHKQWYYGFNQGGMPTDRSVIAQWDEIHQRFSFGIRRGIGSETMPHYYEYKRVHHIDEAVAPSASFTPLKAVETGMRELWTPKECWLFHEAMIQYQLIKQIFDEDGNAIRD